MLADMKLRPKLVLVFLAIGLLSVVVTSWQSYSVARSALEMALDEKMALAPGIDVMEVFPPAKTMRLHTGLIAACVGLAVVAFGLVLAGTIARPIRSLMVSMCRFRAGEHETRTTALSESEIGQL